MTTESEGPLDLWKTAESPVQRSATAPADPVAPRPLPVHHTQGPHPTPAVEPER